MPTRPPLAVLTWQTGVSDYRCPLHPKGAQMADSQPNLPVQYRGNATEEAEFHSSELASEFAGAQAPFGDDVELPIPLERLGYAHPSRAERPNLAGA